MYRFSCGCAWPILQERPGDFPLLDINVRKAPLDCPAVWDMLARGLTKGVFQLESSLGRQWTKRLGPTSVEHVCALTAILRPGCLNGKDEEGVSTTEHYCRRKNGEEEPARFHPVVDEVLKETFNLLLYQESALRLVQVTAGFNLSEADQLRRATGKKLPEEMAKVKASFLDKARTYGVLSEEQADKLFGIIEASQRYGFNKSHAAGYGFTAYDTAYCKVHNPPAFFASWLKNSHDKPKPGDERAELIAEARLMGVEVVSPDFRRFERLTAVDRGVVRLSLADVKGVGHSTLGRLREEVEWGEKDLGRPVSEWAWGDVLSRLAPKVPASALATLARAGAFHPMGVGRKRAAFEIEQLNELSDPEWAWVLARPPYGSAVELLGAVARPKKEGGGCSTANRAAKLKAKADLLRDPPFALHDTPVYILTQETELFGCGVSLTRVDTCDTSDVNCSLKEFIDGRSGPVILGVEVKDVRPVLVKKGKNAGSEMAWLTVADSTAELRDVPLFSEAWVQFAPLLAGNKTIYVLGEQDRKRKGTLLVRNMWPMRPIGG
jgi:DNA polymerase III alpha subunit